VACGRARDLVVRATIGGAAAGARVLTAAERSCHPEVVRRELLADHTSNGLHPQLLALKERS
jgi:hypothetical protein